MESDLEWTEHHRWGSLLAPHMICVNCQIVDTDMTRIRTGTACSRCSNTEHTARLYFPINILILTDLLEETYQTLGGVTVAEGVSASNPNTLILFCALKEALVENLLTHLFAAHHLTDSVRARIEKDNRQISDKINKVFPALSGVKWSEAVAQVNAEHSTEKFTALDEFLRESSTWRNSFLHQGSPWQYPQNVAQRCISALPLLFSLFVSLHNLFVHEPWCEKNGI